MPPCESRDSLDDEECQVPDSRPTPEETKSPAPPVDDDLELAETGSDLLVAVLVVLGLAGSGAAIRSEEHTSELQSH